MRSPAEIWRSARIFTVLLLLLALVLGGTLARYWVKDLEPRLRAEAISQAEVLAQSQAPLLALALAEDSSTRLNAVRSVLDQLLLLENPNSQQPFFSDIGLQVDYSVLDAPEGELDFALSGGVADASFEFEVPLFDPDTLELTGIAAFQVSSAFYRAFIEDVRRQLITQGVIMLAVLLGAWIALMAITAQLARARARRQDAETALAQTEQKFTRLLANLDQYFVYSRNQDGKVDWVSDSVSRVLPGIDSAEFVAGYDRLIANQSRTDRSTDDARKDGPEELAICDGTGRKHLLELRESPVTDATGAYTGADGIARDMTRQREFEIELKDARNASESASLAKSQFLANMSHEIRTPMNAILGMTGLLSRTPLTEHQKGLLGRARSSAHLLLGLINDILDLSRIEAGKLVLEDQEFSIEELFSELGAISGQKAADNDLEIVFDIHPNVHPVLCGDPLRLQQILVNLVTNAIKFTDSGEVIVSARAVEQEAQSQQIAFAVQDTGVGISDADQDALFEPFTQVDQSATRRHGGVGLGLAICKRLVESMGGRLVVTSSPGRGSCFTFSVELALPRQTEGIDRPQALGGLSALVVDDNRAARQVLVSMLERLRIRAEAAENGVVALGKVGDVLAAGRPFDLILMDWKMPGDDGLSVAMQMQERWPGQVPPVLMVSAYGGEELVKKARALGIREFLHKPVNPSTLYDAVLQVTGRPGSRRPMRDLESEGEPVAKMSGDILLVEDNEINQEVAGALLEELGLRVVIASNGVDALSSLSEHAVDLVLMDIQMPGMDGMEVTRRIREHPEHANLPIIALTAHAMMGDRARFLDAGMDDYLSKPIDEKALAEVLARWLPNSERAPDRGEVAADDDDSMSSDSAVINIPEAMSRLRGNAQMLRRLLEQLKHRLPDDIVDLRDAESRDDRHKIIHTAHAIKGAAATLAVHPLAQAADRLEQVARGEDAVGPAVEEFVSRAEEFRSENLSKLDLNPPSEAPDQPVSLDALLQLLRDRDMQAVSGFADLRPRIVEMMGAQFVEKVESAIAGLQFQQALDLLAALQEEGL